MLTAVGADVCCGGRVTAILTLLYYITLARRS
jgi:hypothetical protein